MVDVADESAADDIDLRRKHIHGGLDGVIRCANGLRLQEQTPARQGQIAPFAVAVEDTAQSYQIQNHAEGQGNFTQADVAAEDIQIETSGLDLKLADQDLPGVACIPEGEILPRVYLC